MILIYCTTLLGHVNIMRISCFNKDFASEMKLTELFWIHGFEQVDNMRSCTQVTIRQSNARIQWLMQHKQECVPTAYWSSVFWRGGAWTWGGGGCIHWRGYWQSSTGEGASTGGGTSTGEVHVGGASPEGCIQSGCMHTGACENITFPHTPYAARKNIITDNKY